MIFFAKALQDIFIYPDNIHFGMEKSLLNKEIKIESLKITILETLFY